MEFKKTNKKNKTLRAFGLKYSKAQHLVELVLFFPFLIGIIGILTEIAYGLNTGIELNSALDNAVSIVSSQEKNSDFTIEDAKEEIKDNAQKVLNSRRIPYSDTLDIDILETQGFYVIIGSYTYKYTFKLVNLFFNAIPENFYFKNITAINKSLFMPNDFLIYDSDLNSDLDSNNTTQENTEEETATEEATEEDGNNETSQE